ncbi:uncharacterized protein C19orf44 [Patella vulgata]|uniref:uncharacterized protein C19orf44 n=1 Tax=Patella vulgata TaxID=6465 RepID=UPI0024A9F52C|nr:uncharacterized protein C19orf44 [Patella vulgata]
MDKRNRASTSALLQRVSNQLKGERVPTVTKEEDELTAYLNTVSKRTSQQAKSINFSDYGDISISSSDNVSTPKQKSPAFGAGSKFLKKKVVDEPAATSQPTSKQTSGSALTSTKKSPAVTNKGRTKSPIYSHVNISVDTDTDESRVAYINLPDTSSEQSVGHDGKRFMKRPETPKATTKSEKTNQSSDKSKGSKKDKKKNQQLLSSEESLADFMQRLSSSESTPRPKSARSYQRPADGAPPKPRSPSPEGKPYRFSPSPRTPRKSGSPKVGRRTPSPLALHSRSQSQDSDMIESIVSEVVETPDTASSEELFKVVMDIDALEPALPVKKERDTARQSRNKAKEQKKKSPKEAKKKSTKPIESDVFSSFGLQTVEDLMGNFSDGMDESIASEISEVRFERQDSGRKVQRKESLSEIRTFGSGATSRKNVSLSHTQEIDDSISERIGVSSRQDKSSIASEVKTQYSDETDVEYTEGFESEPESITESQSIRGNKKQSKKEADDKSYSESYTSFSDSRTYSRSYTQSSRPQSPIKRRPNTRNISVQTGEDPGLSYRWKVPMATVGPSYGLDFVDPSPIATHVISPDALEAMTAYSPAMIALHDMLKQQLMLTQSFLSAQERIYAAYNTSLDTNYHYTTLEDTKQYIKQHRKKPLTFKQALKMVTAEMNN